MQAATPLSLRLRPHPAAVAVLVLTLTGAGCADPPAPDAPRAAVAADTTSLVRYVREFVFVGQRAGVPLAVPFAFGATEHDGGYLQRDMSASLAHGAEWDAFLQDSWSAPAAGGVWKVLPRGDLRVLAGGTSEVEALLYRRGDRVLRVTPEILRSTWAPRDEFQYRLFEGRLELGGQVSRGSVLEVYRVQRGVADASIPTGAQDWLFASDGSSVHLVLAEAIGSDADPGKTFAWVVTPEAERSWDRAEVRWLQMRPVEQARRDAPIAWSFRIPGADIEGEVFSLGSDLQVGPDRPGRRALQKRHNVEGWVEIGGERVRVYGLLRHSQE
jgi:hypothetical protein